MYEEVADIIAVEQSGGSDRVVAEVNARVLSRMEADR